MEELRSFYCEDRIYKQDLPENATSGTVVTEGLRQIPDDFRFLLIEGDSSTLKVNKNGRTVLSKRLDRESSDQVGTIVLLQLIDSIIIFMFNSLIIA